MCQICMEEEEVLFLVYGVGGYNSPCVSVFLVPYFICGISVYF